MSDPAPTSPVRFRTGGLSPRKPTRFRFLPDAPARAALAADLDLLALHALELVGEIRPAGRDELVLEARLTARAEQACVVTLAPVPSVIDEPVRRRYVAGLSTPEGDEVEMPEDDTTEPMPEVIDLAEIAAEALALALPLYPRAPGAEFGQTLHAADGVTPLSDADLRPFAGLQDLAAKLAARDRTGGDPGPEEG
ncbi:YceD family protein [Tabrizicola flagellatus]|uniref:YceD family protein n=1 Tax=Tabrizicola flagellatus TaxID=2593021 RepID=UPI0011F15DDD|nr:YceD family protein [Tabrizicola flagellatus]